MSIMSFVLSFHHDLLGCLGNAGFFVSTLPRKMMIRGLFFGVSKLLKALPKLGSDLVFIKDPKASVLGR